MSAVFSGVSVGSGYPSSTFASLPPAASVPPSFFVFVSDWGANGTLARSNGSRWLPVNGQAVLKQQGPSGNIANSETIVLQAQAPINAVQTGDIIQVWANFKKSGVTDTCSGSIRVGTAGTTADSALTGFTAVGLLGGANRTFAGVTEYRIVSATSVLRQGPPSMAFAVQNVNAEPAAAAVTDMSANSLFWTFTIQSTGATDTVALQSGRIVHITN